MSTTAVAREGRSTAIAVGTPMTTEKTVLLLGGTGRTGGRVLQQLLERGVAVRAIVRSAARLPEGALGDARLTVVEAEPLELSDEDWRGHLLGCDAVVSCLGHTTTVRGIFGPPHELVAPVVTRIARVVESMQPTEPVRLVVMSSVSVNRPARADARRGTGERLMISALCGLVPPARDNQAAADFLASEVGTGSRAVEWVVVRPDSLREGDVSGYKLSDELVNSIFSPGETNMANVAHFMCELATDEGAWTRWRGQMPVVVNAG